MAERRTRVNFLWGHWVRLKRWLYQKVAIVYESLWKFLCMFSHSQSITPESFMGKFLFLWDWWLDKGKKSSHFQCSNLAIYKFDKKRQFEFPSCHLGCKSASFSFRACPMQSASSNWRSQKLQKKIKSGFCHFFSHIRKTFLLLRNVQIFLYPHVDHQLMVSEIKKYPKSIHI